MLIILAIYLVLVWVVFSKFKWLRLSWLSGTVAALIGAFILAVFVSYLNYLTPSGRITVIGRIVEVTPNVSGEVVAIPVKTNVPVMAGAVLFQIEPAPFKYKVAQLEAALVGAQQQAEILKANDQQATANVAGLEAQLRYHQQRLNDIQALTRSGATSSFREQDERDQLEVTTYQLQAAQAAQRSAKLALDSEIGGVNTTVIQTRAQLDNAKWELEQTTVRAPANGIVTVMALSIGDRALQARSAMSFIVASDISIVGMFSQNGFRTIKPGAKVTLVFDNDPGHLHNASIFEIPHGIGQGQVAVSGTLARTNAVGGATVYPAVISTPQNIDPKTLRLGMSGTATVFAERAGVIGTIAWVLIWISSYTAFL